MVQTEKEYVEDVLDALRKGRPVLPISLKLFLSEHPATDAVSFMTGVLNEIEKSGIKNKAGEQFKKCLQKGVGLEPLYEETEKGKATRKRYFETEKGKATRKRYFETEKGKEAQKRYFETEKGKEAQKRYFETEKGKEALRRAQKRKQDTCMGKQFAGLIAVYNSLVKSGVEPNTAKKMALKEVRTSHIKIKAKETAFKTADLFRKEKGFGFKLKKKGLATFC
jgi:DNA-binding PadR family transcriptional regulator